MSMNPKKRMRRNPAMRRHRPRAMKMNGGTRRRRRNPTFIRVRNSHRRRGMRNPNIRTALLVGLGAAGGGIATRGITQAFLGSNNTGFVGIGANLGVAWALSFIGEKMKLDGSITLGILAGGVAQAAQRAYEMLVAPAATSALSGLGDPWYSKNGLGDYAPYSPFPSSAFPPVLSGHNAGQAEAGVI